MKRQLIFAFIVSVFGLLGADFSDPAFGDDPFERLAPEISRKESAKPVKSKTNVGVLLASFFSKHISAVDGDRCPSYPTCSHYSAQACRKHGLAMGWLMTVDRLIHEGDEWHFSPVKNRHGKGRIIDPVENNDYWWYKNESPSGSR